VRQVRRAYTDRLPECRREATDCPDA
jgi:hypothetical protein